MHALIYIIAEISPLHCRHPRDRGDGWRRWRMEAGMGRLEEAGGRDGTDVDILHLTVNILMVMTVGGGDCW